MCDVKSIENVLKLAIKSYRSKMYSLDSAEPRNLKYYTLLSWPDFEGRCGEVHTSPEIVLHLP